MFTTSPEAIPSPASGRASSAISASPVVIPIRTSSSPCSASLSRMESAARTARSGSSSCATGAPKTAMTASPMNFSTVPPKRSSSARTCAWYGCSSRRTSSGSMLLRPRCEADEIAEEARDDLALLALRLGCERRRAPRAEARVAPRSRDCSSGRSSRAEDRRAEPAWPLRSRPCLRNGALRSSRLVPLAC